jgi:hypothetical protein
VFFQAVAHTFETCERNFPRALLRPMTKAANQRRDAGEKAAAVNERRQVEKRKKFARPDNDFERRASREKKITSPNPQ